MSKNSLVIFILFLFFIIVLLFSFRLISRYKPKQQALITPAETVKGWYPETEITPDVTPDENVDNLGSFSDEIEQISFSYPTNWQVRTDSQNFKEGDLFSIGIAGSTQTEGTEFFDGAFFSVMKPVKSAFLAEEWIEQNYSDEPVNSVPTVFSEETFGDKVFQKAYVCGLGCFSYYHIKENGKIYGVVYYSAGPDKSVYDSQFLKIMESFSFQ